MGNDSQVVLTTLCIWSILDYQMEQMYRKLLLGTKNYDHNKLMKKGSKIDNEISFDYAIVITITQYVMIPTT